MPKTNSEEILELLAHVVLADKKIVAVEVDAFVNAALGLAIKSENGEIRSRKWLYEWFNRNIEQIDANSDRYDVHEIWARMLSKLEYSGNQKEILESMRNISVSDGYYHLNEKLLVAMAAGQWGLAPKLDD